MPDLPVPAHEPEAVRRAVESVLAREEFARHEPGLWQRITGWVREQVGEVLEALFGSGSATAIGTTILVVAIVVALFAALWFARGVRRGTGPRVPEPVLELRLSPEDWLDRAAAAERDGRWREALRCRYRWLVARLDGLGAVEEEAGRTAGEYVADVRVRAARAAAPFEQATRAFEAAWYGGADIDAAAVDAFRETTEQVLEVVG